MANLEGEAGTSETVSQCPSPGGSRSASRRREDFFSGITQLDFGCYVVTRIPRVCVCVALSVAGADLVAVVWRLFSGHTHVLFNNLDSTGVVSGCWSLKQRVFLCNISQS